MSMVIQLWLPEQPLACSRPTTEACKIPSLEGLWMYGVRVYTIVTCGDTVTNLGANRYYITNILSCTGA